MMPTPMKDIESAAACVRNVHLDTREIPAGVWLAVVWRRKSQSITRYTNAAVAESIAWTTADE